MVSAVDALDRRLVLATIEANYNPHLTTGNPRDPLGPDRITGELALSRIGLHFRGSSGRGNPDVIYHIPFADVLDQPFYDLAARIYFPVGNHEQRFSLGYFSPPQRSSRMGILNGVADLARRAASQGERQVFQESLRQLRSTAQIVDYRVDMNPNVARMLYFANASALVPSLFYANQALECAELQPLILKGVGFFVPGRLKRAGFNRQSNQYQTIRPEEVSFVRRQRAWLLLEGNMLPQLVSESSLPEMDAEVRLVQGIAFMLSNNEQGGIFCLRQAFAMRSQSLLMKAGMEWVLAMENQHSGMIQRIGVLSSKAKQDKHVLLLLAYASVRIRAFTKALDLYLAAAKLSNGFFAGRLPCIGALSLAASMDTQTFFTTAQQLTRLLPDHIEAWEGLITAAQRANAPQVMRAAQERLAIMKPPI